METGFQPVPEASKSFTWPVSRTYSDSGDSHLSEVAVERPAESGGGDRKPLPFSPRWGFVNSYSSLVPRLVRFDPLEASQWLSAKLRLRYGSVFEAVYLVQQELVLKGDELLSMEPPPFLDLRAAYFLIRELGTSISPSVRKRWQHIFDTDVTFYGGLEKMQLMGNAIHDEIGYCEGLMLRYMEVDGQKKVIDSGVEIKEIENHVGEIGADIEQSSQRIVYLTQILCHQLRKVKEAVELLSSAKRLFLTETDPKFLKAYYAKIGQPAPEGITGSETTDVETSDWASSNSTLATGVPIRHGSLKDVNNTAQNELQVARHLQAQKRRSKSPPKEKTRQKPVRRTILTSHSRPHPYLPSHPHTYSSHPSPSIPSRTQARPHSRTRIPQDTFLLQTQTLNVTPAAAAPPRTAKNLPLQETYTLAQSEQRATRSTEGESEAQFSCAPGSKHPDGRSRIQASTSQSAQEAGGLKHRDSQPNPRLFATPVGGTDLNMLNQRNVGLSPLGPEFRLDPNALAAKRAKAQQSSPLRFEMRQPSTALQPVQRSNLLRQNSFIRNLQVDQQLRAAVEGEAGSPDHPLFWHPSQRLPAHFFKNNAKDGANDDTRASFFP